MRPGAALAVCLALALPGLSGCTTDSDRPGAASPAPAPVRQHAAPRNGLSTPVEDSVYPETGDPSVDALRYTLDLTWDRDRRRLTAVERLHLRATSDADRLQLALEPELAVASVRVDGAPAGFTHHGSDLVVAHRVRQDSRHTVEIRYAGSPRPVPAPTERSDFSTSGWTTTADGQVWTMQEPYGAYSWYAVNDQPSDKALYSFTISAPEHWVGVANGTLVSRTVEDGRTVTRWTLGDPASSYLVTIAIGDFERTDAGTVSGVPLAYWTPADRPDLVDRLRPAEAQLAWLEQRLGPFPFRSLGFVVVPSQSGMETQTMITLGDTDYDTSPEVLVHEMAHQWYGDQVTPRDWRDVWMNEGMATYLQAVWAAGHGGKPLVEVLDSWAYDDQAQRNRYGPPADYQPYAFGAGNVYTSPALLWDEVRKRLGDDLFWRLVRDWPATHARGNADYAEITAWWSQQSGEDLKPLFDAWLLGATTPDRS